MNMKTLLIALIALTAFNAHADGIPKRIESRFTYKCDKRAPNGYPVQILIEEARDMAWINESGSTGVNLPPFIAKMFREKNITPLANKPIVDAPVYNGQVSYTRVITVKNVKSGKFDLNMTDAQYGINDTYKNCFPAF